MANGTEKRKILQVSGCGYETLERDMTAGFALFDTAIGRCGIAWGDRGLLGVQLP
ncbi:MAG: methylated-DNA-[protein]-cysteine S-methyltransferase, partial [Afipia broomeae]